MALYNYTVSQKSSHHLTLCNFVKSEPIFKIFARMESVWNLLQNPYDTTHFTLGTLLHYLEKLKIQISADMEENANKLDFKCTNFNFCMCITILSAFMCFFIKILSLSLNTVLIGDKHCSDICCDEFPVPQIDGKSKEVKEQ